jgi:hypothetical protein
MQLEFGFDEEKINSGFIDWRVPFVWPLERFRLRPF